VCSFVVEILDKVSKNSGSLQKFSPINRGKIKKIATLQLYEGDSVNKFCSFTINTKRPD
jgi:hypothetical protein